MLQLNNSPAWRLALTFVEQLDELYGQVAKRPQAHRQ